MGIIYIDAWRHSPDATPDPYFGYVTLLAHMDGADSGTSFPAVVGGTIEQHGNAQTKTAQFKYGTASAYFDGTDDYLEIEHGDGSMFDFGTGDFTLECWVRPSRVNVDQEICAKRTNVDNNNFWMLRITSAGKIRIYNKAGGSVTADISSVAAMSADTWYHIAITRASGSVKIWINGANNDSVTTNGAGAWATTTSAFYIGVGANDLSNDYQGYLDDLRVTNGVARYTATFTPPDAPFPDA